MGETPYLFGDYLLNNPKLFDFSSNLGDFELGSLMEPFTDDLDERLIVFSNIS